MNRTGWRATCTDPACILGTDGYGATVYIHAEFFGTDAESMEQARVRATYWAELHSLTWQHIVDCTQFMRMDMHLTEANTEMLKAIWGE